MANTKHILGWSEILALKKDYPLQKDRSKALPSIIAKIAWEEYHEEHREQSFERIAQRGGFGKYETITLLYKRILKLEQFIRGGYDQ